MSGRWLIGPDYSSLKVYWKVEDDALKAEFITNLWEKWDGKRWVTFGHDVKIQVGTCSFIRNFLLKPFL